MGGRPYIVRRGDFPTRETNKGRLARCMAARTPPGDIDDRFLRWHRQRVLMFRTARAAEQSQQTVPIGRGASYSRETTLLNSPNPHDVIFGLIGIVPKRTPLS